MEADHAVERVMNALKAKGLDENTLIIPNWTDMTIRIHSVPIRHFAVQTVDWNKPCRGLLLPDASHPRIRVRIGDAVPHVDMTHGLPDAHQDGAMVYETDEFLVVRKPGHVPMHGSTSNLAESVVHQIASVRPQAHIAAPPQLSLDTECYGLQVVAKAKGFLHHLTSNKAANLQTRYLCLVCICDPSRTLTWHMALLQSESF